MAIIDNLNKIASSETVTGGTTTHSANILDLKNQSAARKLGTGEQLFLVIHILSNTGGDGSDTLAFALEHAAAQSNSVLTTPADIAVSPTVTGVANLPAGSKVVIPVPPGVAFNRYVGVRYAVTASAVLVVDAYLTNQKPADTSVYPDAI
jgi:6-phosphofructokinase